MKSRLLEAMIASTFEEGRWIIKSEDETMRSRAYTLMDGETHARISFMFRAQEYPHKYTSIQAEDAGLEDEEFQELCEALMAMINRRKLAEREEQERRAEIAQEIAQSIDRQRRARLRGIMEEEYL